MVNELLYLFITVFVLGMLAVSFRLGTMFFFFYLGVVGTTSYFLVPLVINIYGFPTSVAEIFYCSLFLSTDLATEHWGQKKARRIIWLAIMLSISVTVITRLTLLLTPDTIDYAFPHFSVLMEQSYRVPIAGLTSFIIVQYFDVWFFQKIKTWTKGKMLWLRNNLSTMTSQFFDVVIFYSLAFYGVFENLIPIMIGAYIIKVSIAILDTPFIYLVSMMKERNNQL